VEDTINVFAKLWLLSCNETCLSSSARQITTHASGGHGTFVPSLDGTESAHVKITYQIKLFSIHIQN
jgi:hypothetical protein